MQRRRGVGAPGELFHCRSAPSLPAIAHSSSVIKPRITANLHRERSASNHTAQGKGTPGGKKDTIGIAIGQRRGGFTFEVQQEVGGYLGWGAEAQAFSWRVVLGASDGIDLTWRAYAQVCFTGKEATEAAIGIFDAAFLPRAMGIAEIGADGQRIAQFVVVGELGAVVLGEGSAHLGRQTR